MDFELPEELRLLKETVRQFVDRELIPVEMTSMDGPKMRPRCAPIEEKAKSSGCGISTCRRIRRRRPDLLGLCVVWEEIARTIAMPPRGPSVFGPDLRPILFTLNDKQKEKYLHPVLRGEKITAFAQSEPDAAPIPARCGPWRCATAITTSSTATSAGSPARPTPISSSSSPRPTAAKAAAAA